MLATCCHMWHHTLCKFRSRRCEYRFCEIVQISCVGASCCQQQPRPATGIAWFGSMCRMFLSHQYDVVQCLNLSSCHTVGLPYCRPAIHSMYGVCTETSDIAKTEGWPRSHFRETHHAHEMLEFYSSQSHHSSGRYTVKPN